MSIAPLAAEGFVVVDPVRHGDHPVVVLVVADDHLFDAGVDDHALAHGAAAGVGNVPPVRLHAGEVHRGVDHLVAGGADDGVGLGMDAAAQLIAFAAGNAQLRPDAVAHIGAVLTAPGRANVAGGDHLVVLDDDRAVAAAQAGGAFGYHLRQVEIIVAFVSAFHRPSPSKPSACRLLLIILFSV